jgi:hypothetical protein
MWLVCKDKYQVAKLLSIIFCFIIGIGFLGCIVSLATDYCFDVAPYEFLSFNSNCVIGLLCISTSMLLVQWLNQVKISEQILFSFFFYSWHNSNYDSAARRFDGLFSSLETQECF